MIFKRRRSVVKTRVLGAKTFNEYKCEVRFSEVACCSNPFSMYGHASVWAEEVPGSENLNAYCNLVFVKALKF